MSKFELRGNKYYRLSNESSRTINNNIMTDELALEFLKTNPERIKYFSNYPENWRELLGQDPVEEKLPKEETKGEDNLSREALRSYKMKELRQMYPDIKEEFGGKKEDFITQILNSIQ